MPRILLSAFACQPGGGSEVGNGWTWACELARRAEVTVLTDRSFEGPVREALPAVATPPRFVFVGEGAATTEGLAIWRYYRRWQRTALSVARTLHAREPFDVAHHVTYGAHRVPSHLHQLGIPFIWGPVGGGESVPAAFLAPKQIGWREAARELLRGVSNAACRLDPALRACARGATVPAFTTAQTRDVFPRDVARRAVLLPSSILDRETLERIAERRAQPGPPTGLRCMFVGRLLGWKGPTYALRAFAAYAARFPTAELHLYGDGPLRDELRRLAEQLGVARRVALHGRVPRPALLRAYADHHVFLFPSLHDSSGFASLEAMAAGLPVVCLDTGGPGSSVPPSAGIKVRVTSPRRVVADLVAGLEWITVDREAWERASEAARGHALDPEATPDIHAMIRVLYTAARFGRLADPG